MALLSLLVSLGLLNTALAALGCSGTGSSFSDDDRTFMVDYVNGLRSQIVKGMQPAGVGGNYPKGKNMYKLEWDCDLESIAQEWADRCQFEHRSKVGAAPTPGAGENLGMATPDVDNNQDRMRSAADSWWQEFVDAGVNNGNAFTLTNPAPNGVLGHATAMAWARTTKIGCGVSNSGCTFGDWNGDDAQYDGNFYVVCNFREPGNSPSVVYEVSTKAGCTSNADCTTWCDSRCETSTGLCYPGPQTDVNCVDKYSNCASLAGAGGSGCGGTLGSGGTVRDSCRYSCGVCNCGIVPGGGTSGGGGTTTCADGSSSCSSYASKCSTPVANFWWTVGGVKKSQAEYCPKTCGKC